MEEELHGVLPCSSLAVESIIRVGTAGAIWGLCTGPYYGRRKGLTGISQAAFVAKSVGKFSFQCGIVAGIFTITHCKIQKYRGQDDWSISWCMTWEAWIFHCKVENPDVIICYGIEQGGASSSMHHES